MAAPEVTIIGLGALGSALVKALSEQDIGIKSVFNRSEERAQSIASEHGISISSDLPESRKQLAPLVFITVSDGAIPLIVRNITALDEDLSGITFVHCSGNEPADILDSLRQQGARVASMHPLQTFTPQSGPADFEEIYFSLHGDQDVFPILKDIAVRLGSQTLEVSARQKVHLHTAAVCASNYLITLLEASTETAATSGLSGDKVKKALLPLVKTTIQNVGEQSFSEALSGPIKRGDLKTIKDHLSVLEGSPELKRLYCTLGKKTVALALSAKYIDEETAVALEQLLQLE